MDRNAWYFKEPVTYDEMNFGDRSAEAAIRKSFSESDLPYGIVTGYTVTPGAGTTFTVSGTDCIAYDKAGRRIRPTAFPITQSFATATDGGNTSVVSSGNERWVSVFARGGRKFIDAATDGNLQPVRRTAIECLNALGDAEHPDGAYNATTAKEAGVDKFYILVGTEAVAGSAVRPGLIDDGVLIADFRLTYGLGTLTAANIYFDRRQILISGWRQGDLNEYGRYFGNTGPKYGPIIDTTITTSTAGWYITISGGRGYAPVTGATGTKTYRAYNIDETPRDYPVQPGPVFSIIGGNGRHDLVVVDATGQIQILTGVAGSPLPPAAPAGTVVLAELYAPPQGVLQSTYNWVVVKRGFRRLPYPYSTQSGIIEGCRLAWDWTVGQTGANLYVISTKNKIAFDGEVVEFAGGFAGGNGYTLSSVSDTANNPFATAAPATENLAYFVYACRNQYWSNDPVYGSVLLVESKTIPDFLTGRPSTNLSTSRGTIPPADAMLVGIGWVRAGTTARMPVIQSDDGWFSMLAPNPLNGALYKTGSTHFALPAGGDFQLPGAPYAMVDLVKVRVMGDPQMIMLSIMNVSTYGHSEPGAFLRGFCLPLHTGTLPSDNPTELGDFVIPAPNGLMRTSMSPASTYWSMQLLAVHVQLPRINFGA